MTLRTEPRWLPHNPFHHQPPSLTARQRDEIGFRRMEGETVRALAAEYGVSTDNIRRCVPKERP